MNLSFLAAVGGIALVDMVLSGDNALVIAAAASKLPRSQRFIAVLWGGFGAIILRLLLAIAATKLLTVEYLQAAGGVLLFFITIHLLVPENPSRQTRPAADRFLHAIVTIMVADTTMSLDNVLAVGALAAGNIPLLVAGVFLSMVLIFGASTLIARLMERFTWLLDLAALVLGWTAANLIFADPAVTTLMGLKSRPNLVLALHFAAVALVLLCDLCLRAILAHRALQHVSIFDAPDTPSAVGSAHPARLPRIAPAASPSAEHPPTTSGPLAAPPFDQSSIAAPRD